MEDDSLIAYVDSTRKVAKSLRPEKGKRGRKGDTPTHLFTILVKDSVLQMFWQWNETMFSQLKLLHP